MDSEKIQRQFGLWDSPVSPTSLANENKFVEVDWNDDDALIWVEYRSDRNVLVVQPPGGEAFFDLNSQYSARGGLAYGGGEFAVGYGQVYFVDAHSGRVYCQSLKGGTPQPITPGFGDVGSPSLSPDGRWLLFIRSYEDRDSLEIVDTQGKFWPQRLVTGSDFYMQPAWHPQGRSIAWVEWNHPNMPWNGASLYQASLNFPPEGLPVVDEIRHIDGDENNAVYQPIFSPQGNALAYASEASGWWQLYLYNLDSQERSQLTDTETEHARPTWVQGLHSFDFSSDGRYLYFLRNQAGFISLWRLDLDTGVEQHLALDESYTYLEQLRVSPDGKRVALLASAGNIPQRVITCRLPQGMPDLQPGQSQTHIWRRSMSAEISLATYAAPQAIEWTGMDAGKAYGLFYPPQNPYFESVGKPPLVVRVHGGPTSQRYARFEKEVQFFTSRGYAVLEVNYRGSTGYGREYRDKLRGNWGIYDVEDSVSGARHLVEQGKVDGERLVIIGGSAGGFTVLKTLQDYPGFFKAGVAMYAVSDQFGLATDTHKFEIYYSDYLLGPLPQAAELLRERSPINYVDKIKDPLAIFQGEKDKIVPRWQSDKLAQSLEKRGVTYVYHVYEGEGHGFRKTETVEHLYKTIDEFLRQHVIYA
jgi:dipeptidyl aminopeptidase/acylaminoacyl peptidase